MSGPAVEMCPAPAVGFAQHVESCTVPQARLLRVSVTDLCNFRCHYCVPAGGVAKTSRHDLLSLEDLAALVQWLIAQTGIDRVKLTGGEPLVRRGIQRLIAELSSLPGVREVSLTTNGSLLPQMAYGLKAAGLSRVNISLDSLDEKRFAMITRGGRLDRTLAGIEAAREAGLTPIKINAVLQRSTWREEVPQLLTFAASNHFELRFIELMRTGTERAWCESEFISVNEVREQLGADVQALPGDASPAKRTLVDWHGESIQVGWITPRSHPFCSSCERLRIDARGRLRRCLMDEATLDLAKLLQAEDRLSARRELASYLGAKVPPRVMDSGIAMSQIGG